MKKNKFLYSFDSPEIGEIVYTEYNTAPAIYVDKKNVLIKPKPLVKCPDNIYHYCNKTGFEGIIKTNSLWLSTLRKTNDNLEIIYFYQRFKQYIKSQRYNLQELSKVTFLDKTFRLNLQNAFSTSFTTLKDISWQWNEYGDKNKGFVIGFSSEKLTSEYSLPERTGLIIKKPSLLKVDYNEKSHKNILKIIIADCLKNKIDIIDAALYFAKIACLCKTPKWCNEQEWRLLHFPLMLPEIETSLYTDKSNLTKIDSYKYAYKIPFGSINEIIIGSKNPMTVETVKKFLNIYYREEEISKIKIYRSRNHF